MSMTVVSRTTPPATRHTVRMPRAERREQILRAAARSFLAGGYDGTSMEDVARAAGVTRLIVYRIFETKDALYLAVLQEVVDELVERVDAPTSAPADSGPAAGIVAILFASARQHPDAFRLLWRHAAHEPAFADRAQRFRQSVHEFGAGLLASSISDPLLRRWASEALVAHLHESICLWLDDGDPSRDDELCAYLTAGVRATVAQWSSMER